MRYIAFLAALVAALTLAPPAAAATDWAWPVRGDVVTPYKNGDDPYAAGQHRGIDIAAPVGTRVSAARGGRVTFAGVAGSSGLTVNVRTADGRYDVSYLHLSAAAAHEGDIVGRGDPIGAVGTSGTRSIEQPHLHLGVREAGDRHAYRDPLDFLPPPAPPATEEPPAAPAEATEPLVAPPAPVPALSRAPAEVTTGALDALPSDLSLGALAVHGSAVLPASAPDAPGASGAPATRTDVSAPRAAHGSAAAGAHGSATPAAHGSATPARHRGSGTRVTPQLAKFASSSSSAHRSAAAPRGQAITRADLASPSGGSSPARQTDSPAPRLHLATADRRARADRRGGDGLDIGWLAAVVGLITLAVCLGRPQQARRAARTSRSAVGAVLRPLAGRG
jgi:hypothetical protein